MEEVARSRWIVLMVKLAAGPSRHRVAVWRELRKVGALSLGQGVWAVPDVPVFAPGLARARELTDRADGETITLRAAGITDDDGARFEAMFTAAREDDWSEFLSDCGKYEAELDKEIRTAKFTLAELDEEEQSLDRLRRWHRDIKARDVFGAPSAVAATERLRVCTARLQDYTERVFDALHGADAATADGGEATA